MLYFTLWSVLIFSAVMSAVIGYLFQAVINTLISAKNTTPLIGAGIAVLTVCFLINVLLFGIWYMYVLSILLTAGLYIVLFRAFNKSNER